MSAIKINGTWQRVSSIKIKQNGVWNDHTALYARLDGAWHLIDLAAEAQGPAYHVWKAYADDAFGNGISLSPEGKEYIGFAVGQRVEEPDLSDPSLYDWSLIKGADGKDVDPEVLAEILEKQDGYNSSLYDVNDGLYTVEQALADADSRLKAADVALSQALQTAQVDFSSSVDSLNESISEVENDLLNLVSLSGEQGSSITQLENTTDEQAQKIAVLETNDGSTRSRVASLESTSGEQATRLSSLGVWDGESFATIKTLEEADAENASLIRTLETRGEEADSKIASLESTSSSHASRLSTVETRSTNAQNRAAALEVTTRTHATRLTNVETKADDIESKVSTLEQTSEGHASRLTNVETKAATGINKANAAQASADAANSGVSEVTNRVSTLEETSEGHASRLTNVETKATTAVSKANAAQNTANSGISKANAAQTAADNAQETADSANTKVTEVTNRVSTLEETSEGHASRLTNVETKATSAVNKANNAQSTANSGVSKANAAQESANEANTKVTNVTNRVTKLEETSEGHASRLSTVETTATSGVNKANAAQSTANSATTKANNAQNTANSGVSKANTAQAKADSAYSKVTAVTSRVSTLESTTEAMATKVDEVSFSRANLVTRGVFGSNLSRGGWTSGSVVSTQAVGIPTLSGRPYVLKLTSRDCYDYNAKFPISVGDKVYISAWVYTTDTNVSFNIGFRQVLDGVEQSSWPTIIRTSDRSGKWVYVEGTYTHTASGYNGLAPFLQLGGSGTMPPVYISDIVYSRSSHSGALAAVTDESKAYVDQQTGELKAERVIKADANGKVSGVHLLANGSGAEAGGKLYFQADEIAIVPPNWNGSSELNKRKFPFYFSEDRNYMYLDEATIQRLSAETIDSGSLAVDGLTLLTDNLSLPAGSVREHMIDPAFSDGIVRVNPDAEVLGGTKSVSSTGIGQGKKITVPALKSGGSAQKMTISVVGPNASNRKDVRFDLEMKVNGAAHNFSSGTAKIRLASTISYSEEDEGFRIYRTSFKFEDEVILPAPTKGNQYTYEFIITNMSFSPASTSTYNYADKLKFSISVSEPTVSSGGFITDVRWSEVKDQPSFVALDTSGDSDYPRMLAGNNPASSNAWLRVPTSSGGLLPYSNGNSRLGTSAWKFKEMHSVNFYENGVALSSKYLGKSATAVNASNADKLDGLNSSQFLRSDQGGAIEGPLSIRHTNVQLNLVDTTYSDHYWQFDHQNGVLGFRYDGGSIAFQLNRTGEAVFNHNVSAPSITEGGTTLSSKYLGKTATAVNASNADKLDGLHASSFSRSNHGHTGLGANTWGGIRSINQYGYIDFGPANESYAHIYTDRPSFYFNKDLDVNGNRVWHNGNTGSVAKKSSANVFTTGQKIDATGTVLTLGGSTKQNSADVSMYIGNSIGDYGFYFVYQGSKGGNDNALLIQSTNQGAPKSIFSAKQDGSTTLYSTTTFNSSTVFLGSMYVRNIIRIFSSNGANQRVDTRDEGDEGRAHWYGQTTSGGTRAFKHAWYDGSDYVNVDVSGQTVKFSGAVDAQGGLKQDGHTILNGSDTWVRTKGDQGIYFSSYGGGWRMTDTNWIRAYGNKMLYITNGSTSSIRTTGGVHANQGFRRDNNGSSWISQRDSTQVAVYNSDAVKTDSYAAAIRQRHASYTWSVGGLGNRYFGFFSYTNSRTSNGTDGYFRMDYKGNCTASGKMYAPDFVATSDKRVKDNIKVIPDALEKVCKLTGNTYTRNDLEDKPSAGIIAQEVQKVLPEAVTEAEGRLQVAHNGVIGLLVEAVKELKQQLGTALTEIDGLKEANNG
ncbi:alanine-zipper protein [Pseudoalteromonas agarivorans]|uniref:alanine-zipper protein n=1 Tax=Pseudoalteromonas agarivorans TaxID=176102 RepID=UPI00249B7994|nr:alanine-zipper protein [Pseudoalteromonas agarivorans]MDI3243829.1 alanine-zipper protein [Pseudoalteromonas agarivorans]